MARLQTANIPLIDDTEDSSSGSGLKYHKSLVIDQTKVITGSANLTSSGLHDDAGRPSSRGNEQIKRGIEIRLVADLGFASRPCSEVLDLLGVSLPDHTCKVEAGNKPLDQALRGVGTPHLAHGDKLHHKFAVIDNKAVITGASTGRLPQQTPTMKPCG